MSITKATLITSSQAFTGSVVKIQALGGTIPGSCSLDRIEYGSQDGHTLFSSGYTASAVLSFTDGILTVPIGHSIDGPINRLKSKGSDSTWLIYHR